MHRYDSTDRFDVSTRRPSPEQARGAIEALRVYPLGVAREFQTIEDGDDTDPAASNADCGPGALNALGPRTSANGTDGC